MELKGVKTFYDLSDDYAAVAVVSLKENEGKDNDLEGIDGTKESIRIAAAGTLLMHISFLSFVIYVFLLFSFFQ